MKTLSKPETSNVFWAIPAEQQLKQLTATRQGLNTQEAKLRIKHYGANRLNTKWCQCVGLRYR